MTSKMNTKIRLVRCPKCRNVLPEPPEVQVYECGGCGAKLQVKKPKNTTVDTTVQRLEEDTCGKQKMEQVSNDQEAGSSSNQASLVNSISNPDLKSDHSDLHSSTEDHDADENVENSTIGSLSGGVNEYLFGKQKMRQLSGNRNDPRSSTELSGHEDPESSPEFAAHNRIVQEQKQENDHYQEEVDKEENVKVNTTSVEFEHSSSKQKMEELSDDPESDSSLNKKSLANSINEQDRNKAYNGDPESSPESTVHSRLDHHDQEFLSCRNGGEFEESSKELTSGSSSELNEIKRPSRESISKKKIIRDSEGGSKSSFKTLIAEKLLDTRQKKPVYMVEDDILSDDESADLNHRPRFNRVSSVETLANTQFGGTSNYYGYEGSTSSFDGNESQFTRKNRMGFKGDEHVDSGNVNRFKRRNRLTDARPVYGLKGFHANARHSSPMIPENPKMERIELLKMVRELQDQLDRTNISNSQQFPPYYNHALNNPERYAHRMAFSGETTAVNRQHEGSSSYQCYPQDRYFSAQLPRQHAYSNGSHYGPNTYYSPRYSGHPSPQRPSESEFSAPVRYDMTKKKRFVRPIAGGAPWITCYRCSELLQLPQSFLVFKKRSHSLRCGACLKVLNFTLDGTHVSRYYPEEMIAAPPSSEVEDYDKSTGSRAYPVSCSDRSFQKSYSTETDKKSSREFSEKRGKATMSRDPSDSTRPSSSKTSGRRNTTSEIEEVGPTNNGSPLHWLMGYASPSKVIRGS